MERFSIKTNFRNVKGGFTEILNENLSMEDALFLLPVSFAGVVRLMMHPGDHFCFTSHVEETTWEVTRTA